MHLPSAGPGEKYYDGVARGSSLLGRTYARESASGDYSWRRFWRLAGRTETQARAGASKTIRPPQLSFVSAADVPGGDGIAVARGNRRAFAQRVEQTEKCRSAAR